MTVRMGRKLAEAAAHIVGESILDKRLRDADLDRVPVTYPVVLGALFAHIGLSEEDAFAVHQYGVAMMVLSAALRLMRVSHLDTQAILYAVNATAVEESQRARTASLEDMAGFIDVLAAAHPHTRSDVHELTACSGALVKTVSRIGIGGPVGSGKTAIIEAIVPKLVASGLRVLVVTNDVVTTEDAQHVRRALTGVLVAERIVGVETGACPHTAIREDPSMNLAAVEDSRVAVERPLGQEGRLPEQVGPRRSRTRSSPQGRS